MSNIILFESKKVQTYWDSEHKKFNVTDVVEFLINSRNLGDYWNKMKTRVKTENSLELSPICQQLKLEPSDKKMRETQ